MSIEITNEPTDERWEVRWKPNEVTLNVIVTDKGDLILTLTQESTHAMIGGLMKAYAEAWPEAKRGH